MIYWQRKNATCFHCGHCFWAASKEHLMCSPDCRTGAYKKFHFTKLTFDEKWTFANRLTAGEISFSRVKVKPKRRNWILT